MSCTMFPLRLWLAAGALALTVSLGCGDKPPVEEGDGGTDAGCEGQLGCACTAGTCAVGECVGGTCTDCRRGEAACICRGNSTCNEGLRCSDSLCEACPAGAEGCACEAGACSDGLVCSNGTCVKDSCTPGTVGCPCQGGTRCGEGAYCDSTQRCQSCSSDIPGCPCGTSGVCTGGLVCEGATTTCRAAFRCADLLAQGLCAEHQVCTETPGSDAVCAAETCEEGYKWDSFTLRCIPCVSEGCAAEPTCEPGPGSLTEACNGLHRLCVQAGASASCGGCAPGFMEQPATDGGPGQCIPAPTCGAVSCGYSEYCETKSGTPTCQPLPCPLGSAQLPTGECEACSRSCTGPGFTGRVWPVRSTLQPDQCLCETLDGYFLPAGGSAQAVLCDADGDGWVREEADDTSVTIDPARKANARCTLRRADRVRLVDEYGLAAEVVSCTDGMKMNPDAGTCTGVVPLRLLETQRNDIPGSPKGSGAPLYGPEDGGTPVRLLEAAELNPLTKACVSTAANYNDRGGADIDEVQTPTASSDDQARLLSFAYFVELYSGFYEAPAAGQPYGTLVIKERSRCAADFPLRYDPSVDPLAPTDGYRADAGTTQWRNCTRGRDPSYNKAQAVPGFDFARFSCDAPTGTCDIAPAAHTDLVAPTSPDTTLLRDIGLCEVRAHGPDAVPKDGLWRGMHHHSQFKCVNVVTSRAKAYDRARTEFGPDVNQLTFNACVAAACPGTTGAPCSVSQGEGLQTRQPVVSCKAQTSPELGLVGFAATNYRPYGAGSGGGGAYLGGCINEDHEYLLADAAKGTYTCPYPEFSLTPADANKAFGRFSCFGKGSNFLWGDSSAPAVRATLRWSPSANETANGVLR